MHHTHTLHSRMQGKMPPTSSSDSKLKIDRSSGETLFVEERKKVVCC
jgi:hypothetical protein